MTDSSMGKTVARDERTGWAICPFKKADDKDFPIMQNTMPAICNRHGCGDPQRVKCKATFTAEDAVYLNTNDIWRDCQVRIDGGCHATSCVACATCPDA